MKYMMKTLMMIAMAVGVCGTVQAAGDNNYLLASAEWQKNMIYHPTESQIRAENKGRVFIYQGLKDVEISRAMDERFDRIDRMMFVNTVVTNKSGAPAVDSKTGAVIMEDDGC